MDDPVIGFIGAGAVGKGLALGLASSGYRVLAVSSRSLSSAQGLAARIPGCEALPAPQKVADKCNLVFITTPDEAIEQVASQVSWHHGQGVVHCSGAESLEILEHCRRSGCNCRLLPPLSDLRLFGNPGGGCGAHGRDCLFR